jgi:quercetin dioxygenase-like cupin family protein
MMSNPALGATSVLRKEEYQWFDFPIPGHTGELKAAFLNRDLANGPVMAMLEMKPGSRIPAHSHKLTTETFLVLEGTFVNAGVSYGPGAFFSVKVGDVHGPHEAPQGCTILFVQAVEVDPTDFFIEE